MNCEIVCLARGLTQVSSVRPGQIVAIIFLLTGCRAGSLTKYELKRLLVRKLAVAVLHEPGQTINQKFQ